MENEIHVLESEQYLSKLCKVVKNNSRVLDLFFKITPDTSIITLDKLRPIRAREEGIKNAMKYMYEASQGNHTKREPLTITPLDKHPNSYKILDGNSTWHVAKKIGMEFLPVLQVKSRSETD